MGGVGSGGHPVRGDTTIAELERGAVAKERTDAGQGGVLRRWLEERVLSAFAGRVLSFDLPAARIRRSTLIESLSQGRGRIPMMAS